MLHGMLAAIRHATMMKLRCTDNASSAIEAMETGPLPLSRAQGTVEVRMHGFARAMHVNPPVRHVCRWMCMALNVPWKAREAIENYKHRSYRS